MSLYRYYGASLEEEREPLTPVRGSTHAVELGGGDYESPLAPAAFLGDQQ